MNSKKLVIVKYSNLIKMNFTRSNLLNCNHCNAIEVQPFGKINFCKSNKEFTV